MRSDVHPFMPTPLEMPNWALHPFRLLRLLFQCFLFEAELREPFDRLDSTNWVLFELQCIGMKGRERFRVSGREALRALGRDSVFFRIKGALPGPIILY